MSAGLHRKMSRGQHRKAPRRIAPACRSILKGMVAMPLVFILANGVAEAYWSAGSGAGGNGASTATAVNQGATPTASAAGSAVTVSWAARTLSNGTAVAGYLVKRYDAGTLTLQTILSACTGTVAVTTCTENIVPEGQWKYSVTPVFATNWRGPESVKSATVTVDVTAPVNSISLSGVSGNAVKSGNTIYYRGAALGSFTLTNAVTDSGSGPASSTAATLTGTTTGWTHTQTMVSTPAGGPYVSTSFSWTAGTTSSPTEVVTGRDVANNATGTTLTFVNDSTGPTGGSVAASGLVGTGALYAISATLSLDLVKGTDPSGVATSGAQLLRATGTLTSSGGTADGACTAYGSYTLVTSDPVSPKSDIVADQACYKYQYVVADTLGNSTTYTSADIKVDLTAPTPAPSLTFGTFTNTYWASGSTVFYRGAAASGSFTATASATDPKSGIFSYAFPALGTNWSSTPGSLGVNTYSWNGAPAAPGTKTVTATNNATGISGATSFTPTVDNTAPTGATLPYANTTITSTTFSVDFTNGTDGGSGLGTRLLQRQSTTLTGTTCGTFSGTYTTLANGTNPSSPLVDTVSTGNCYMYRYVVSDNVGNTNTTTSPSVVKVTTANCATPGDQPALIASGDSQIDQASPNTNNGTAVKIDIRTRPTNDHKRGMFRFTLPALPAGCTVTLSKLRLYQYETASGRVMEAYQGNPASAIWTEAGVTWANQPGTAGTPATSTTTGTVGWQTWTVTTHVQAHYTGPNNGFVVRDSVEGSGDFQQRYRSRNDTVNVTQWPELIVTWG